MSERKPNFSPPGWLVTRFDVTLPEDTAKRFDAYRRMRTAGLDPEDHTGHEHLHWNALIVLAIELLLVREAGP